MLSMFGRVFRGSATKVEMPEREALTMRALEPRVLLDAAALETAMEAADMADLAAGAEFETFTMGGSEAPRDLSRDVVFIDGGISEIGSLLAEIDPSVEVHVLDLASDGVTQIAAVLEGREDLAAVHIFAHGAQGVLSLGAGEMSSDTITGAHVQSLQRIGAALGADGDILLYGCDFGSGPEGRAAAEALARVTGADVAASDDLTGAADKGGDWDLEVTAGRVEAAAFSFEGYAHTFAAFEISVASPPEVTQADGSAGVEYGDGNDTYAFDAASGTGPSAVWREAGTVNGQAVDIRATVTGVTDGATVGFQTVSVADPTRDDMRIIIGDNGSATVIWEVFLAGTNQRPTEGEISLTINDIDGNAGNPNTIEAIAANLNSLSSYTIQDPSNQDVTNDGTRIISAGTQNQDGEQTSWVQFSWANANQLELTYFTFIDNDRFFNHDGDGDLVFTNPNTAYATGIDLDADDSSGATGSSYQTIFYSDGTNPGQPVAIADGDVTVDNVGNRATSATIRLTNALADDVLVADPAILGPLGLTADVDDSVAGEITVTITGAASVADYQTAIQAVTYASTDPTPVQSVRSLDVQVFDGAFASGIANTTVSFGTLVGQPATVRDLFVGQEDADVSVAAADGLLANDSDPQGETLTVTGATDTTGNAIPVNAVGAAAPVSHTLPSGGTITLYADGSLDYVPAPDFSGVETFDYVASDPNGNTSSNYAAINVQGVADTPSANASVPAAGLEDGPSGVLSLSPASADTDGSESFRVSVVNVPAGVTVTDGVRIYEAGGESDPYFLDGWDLDNISVTAPAHSDRDVVLTVVTEATEPNGSTASSSEQVTFAFDAVADRPVLAAVPGGGGPGTTIPVSPLVQTTLTDRDGSEEIDRYTVSNIDPDLAFTLNGAPVIVTNGSFDVDVADWPALRVTGPGFDAGGDNDHTFDVVARASEVNAENGVAVQTAESDPVTVTVTIDLVDDPVTPRDDSVRVNRGVDTVIVPLANDDVPDGGPLITRIDGQTATVGDPITLTSGDATVTLNADGTLTLTSLAGAPDAFSFDYTLEDADGSEGTAAIAVALNPTWRLTGDASVTEGDAAAYTLELVGAVPYGATSTVDISRIDVTTSGDDVADLDAAVLAAIAGQPGWSYANGRLEYAYVNDGYSGVYEADGPALIDISTTGTPINAQSGANAGVQPIGFAFDYFGTTYTQMSLDDDGRAFFGAFNDPALLSVYDAFIFNPGRGPGDVYHETIGAPGSRQFIAQWEEITGANGSETATFQIILNEADGTIEYRYEDVDLEGNANDNGDGVNIRLNDGGTQVANPAPGGTVANGSRIVWTPGAAAPGALAIQLTASEDGTAEPSEDFRLELSAPAGSTLDPAFSVTTTILDDDPDAVDDAGLSTPEETPLRITPLDNDIDNEGGGLTITRIGGAAVSEGDVVNVAGGSVELLANGELLFTPTTDANGPVSFTYEITDASGDTDVASVSVDVTPVDDAPVLTAPATATTGEDTDLVFPGTIAVGDVDSASVTVTLSATQGTLFATAQPGVSRGGQGTGTLTLTGSPADVSAALDGLAFTPRADYFGADTLTIAVDDGTSVTTGSVAIDVTLEVDVADDREVLLGTDVVTIDLTANDTFEGPVTDLVISAAPANGTATVNADRTVNFEWTGPASGLDRFDYTVTAGGVTETATAVIVRHPEPTAADDAGATTEEQVLTVAADGLVANDTATPAPALDYDAVTTSGASGTWDTGGGERPFAWTGGVSVDNAPTTGRPGITQALVFDGTGGATATDFGTLNADTGTSDATFETWLRYDPTGLTNGVIVFETGGTGDGMSIALTQDATGTGPFDNVRVQFNDSGTQVVLHGDLADLLGAGSVAGEFIQIAAVYDAGATDTVSLYVNGVLLDRADATGLDDWDGGSDAGLGTTANGPNVGGLDAFVGEIAELRFTEAALDQGQVKNAFDAVAGLAATPASLTTGFGASVEVNADGSYTYDATGVPAVQALRAGETITDTFDYEVTDANGVSDTATATITITGVNDAPEGADGSATLAEDGVHTFAVADFGFTDPVDGPGDALSQVVFTTVPGAGILVFDDGTDTFALNDGDAVSAADIAAGRLSFRPAANGTGAPYAGFTFQVRDDGGTANGGADLDPTPASFTLNVTPANDAPEIDLATTPGTGASVAYTENAPLTLVAPDATILDVDDTTLPSLSIALGGFADGADETLALGGQTFAATGPASFTATAGAATFAVTSDGTIVSVTRDGGGEMSVTDLQALLRTLGYQHASDDPTGGSRTLSVSTADGDAPSNTAVATIAVAPVNDAPTAADNTRTTQQNTPVIVNVLANDSDVDGTLDPTSVRLADPANPGTFVTSLNVPGEGRWSVNTTTGQIAFIPEGGFTGPATPVTYRVADDGGLTDTATLSVTVAEPTLTDDTGATREDVPVTIDVLGNDGATDNLTTAIVDQPANGTVTVNPDGTVEYVPDADFHGTDTFCYTVTPPSALYAGGDARFVEFGQTTNILVLGNDGYAGSATVTILDQPANGTATVEADGSVTYVPDAGYEGTDAFTYQLTDDNGSTAATVDLSVLRDPMRTHFVAPRVAGHSEPNNPVDIVLNTASTDPVTVTIREAGTGIVVATRTITVFDGDETVTLTPGRGTMPNSEFGTVTTAGLIVEADAAIRVDLQQDGGNAQSFQSTLGRYALGTEFYTGSIASEGAFDGDGDGVQFVSVMAENDGTVVTIERPAGSAVAWGDGADADGDGTITVTLNAGETYTVRATSGAADLTGAHVTSTDLVAVSTGSSDYRSNGAGENGWTQVAPIELVGTQYVIRTAISPIEQVSVVATQDGTDVFLDGVLQTTLNAGEVWQNDFADGRPNDGGEDLTSFALETSRPTYVFQQSGIVDARDENGLSHIPPLDLDGIAETRFTTPSTGADFYVLTASSAAPTLAIFEVDPATDTLTPYVPGDLTTQAVTGNAQFTVLDFSLPGDRQFLIRSDAQVQVGMLAASGSGGGYGYLSGFEQSRIAAASDNVAAVEGRSVDILPLLNDQTTTGTAMTITSFGDPANGTVTDLGGGRLQYTPDAGFTGLDSFTYSVTDADGNAATATVQVDVRGRPVACVTVTVDPVPDPARDAVTTAEDTPVSFDVLANDPADDGTVSGAIDALPDPAEGLLEYDDGTGFVPVTAGSTLTAAELSTLRFTPAADFNGALAPIGYTVTDANGDTGSATIELTVTPVADAPEGTVPAAQSVPEDDTLVFSAANANAILVSDADGDTLTVTFTVAQGTLTAGAAPGVTLTGNGTSTVTLAGSAAAINAALDGLAFAAPADFNGDETLAVAIDDGTQTTNAAVDIAVTPVADITDDIVTTDEDTAVSFNVLTGTNGATADTFEGAPSVTANTDPAHGTATVAPNGDVTYTPDSGYNGTDTFTYTVTSGGVSETATVTIDVGAVNDAPVNTVPGAQTVAEDADLAFAGTLSVADPDGGTVQTTLAVGEGTLTVAAGSGASVTGQGTGTVRIVGTVAQVNAALDGLVYAGRPDFHGADTLTVTTDDLSGTPNASDTDTVAITVTSVADITDDAVTTDEDVAVTFNAFQGTNGATADGFEDANRTVTAVTQGANGTVTFLPDGTLTYTPNADWNGTDTFTYTVETATTGGGTRTETATVTVTVDPVNDGPAADPEGFTVAEDGSVTIDVLDGDTDPEGDPLTITQVDGQPVTEGGTAVAVTNGTVRLVAGQLVFEPADDYNGPAAFTYTITDGSETAQATVSGTVTPVNDAPTADDETFTVAEDGAVTIDVLDGDADLDGDTLTITHVDGQPVTDGGAAVPVTNGSVALVSGQLVFTPTPDYNGPAAFTYTITDGTETATADVAGTVTPENDAPTADPETFTVQEDGSVTIDVLDGDADIDGDTLTITQVDGLPIIDGGAAVAVANGSVRLVAGELVFEPVANYNGPASFTYTITDGSETATATVSGDVTPQNDDPTATGETFTGPEDADVTGNVLANDTDLDGNALAVTTFTVDGQTVAAGDAAMLPGLGTLAIAANGAVTFSPEADWNGSVPPVTYTVADGQGGTAQAVLDITVTPENDAPTAGNDGFTVVEDGSVSIDVLDNDADLDGDPLTITQVDGQPITEGGAAVPVANGTVRLVSGELVFEPTANYNGPASFGYTITDGIETAQATVSGTVTPENDAPTADDDTFTVAEDGAVSIDVLDNDVDLDGDALTITHVEGQPIVEGGAAVPVTNGTVKLVAGQLVFEPADDYNGPASFDYTVSDGTQAVDATVSGTVTPENDRPVAGDDVFVVVEDGSVSIPVLGNDSDADGDTLTITHVDGQPITEGGAAVPVANGSVALVSGELVFTPTPNYSGPAAFDYTVSDGTLSDDATVSGTVGGANDGPIASVPGPQSVAEDAPLVFSAAEGRAITVADVDGDVLSVTLTVANGTLSASGSAVAGGNGSATLTLVGVPADVNAALDGLVFLSDPDVHGTDQLAIAVDDGTAVANRTVDLTVAPVADIADDAVAVAEDGTVTFDALAGTNGATADTFEDAARAVTAVTQGANGTVSFAGDAITYTPDPDFRGTDTFTYTVTAGGTTETATVTVTVTPVNDAPEGTDATVTLSEDTPRVLAPSDFGFTDPNDSPADAFSSVIFDGAPTAGRLVYDDGTTTYDIGAGDVVTVLELAMGFVSFVPAADANGTPYATLDFRVADDGGTLDGGADTDATPNRLTFAVTPVNDAPAADPDGFTVAEDGSVSIDVLDNDVDLDGDALTITRVDGQPITDGGAAVPVANGTVKLVAGELVFEPADDYNGPASFTYTITDGTQTATATVSGDVVPANDGPAATGDTFTVAEDGSVTIDVLDNDTDIDGDTLTITQVDGQAITEGGTVPVANGSVRLVVGELVFTPAPNYHGPAGFTYTVSDGTETAQATASGTVTPRNDAPVALADTASGDEDTTVTGDVLANDSDVDGDTLTVTAFTVDGRTGAPGSPVTLPGIGALDVAADGTFVFVPEPDWNGSVPTVTYTATDGTAPVSQTLDITIAPVADAPRASDDVAFGPEDSVVSGDVLTNDVEPDGEPLAVSSFTVAGLAGTFTPGTTVAIPGAGTLLLDPNGSFAFAPEPDFNGPVPLVTYTVTDGTAGGTDEATLAITLAPVNDAPEPGGDTFVFVPGTAISVPVLNNDSDPEGSPLTIVAVNGQSIAENGSVPVTGGTVTLVAGELVFDPAPGFADTTAFTYTVEDADGGRADADVAGYTGSVVTPEDETFTGRIDAGDPAATVAPGTAPMHGTFDVQPDGSFTYTPDPNYNGPDGFTVVITQNGASTVVPIDVTVTPVNDAPTGSTVPVTTAEETPVSGTVTMADIDGDVPTASLQTPPLGGAVVVNPDGTYTYTPKPNFNGPDVFTVLVDDGRGGTVSVTVDVEVTPVDGAPSTAPDTFATAEDTPVTLNLLGNDSDGDGGRPSLASVAGTPWTPGDTIAVAVTADGAASGPGNPAVGTVRVDAAGTVTFEPATDYNGPVAFDYEVTDGATAASGSASGTVTAVNDPPVAQPDPFTVAEDGSVTIPVLANDTDADGDPLAVTHVDGQPITDGGPAVTVANGTVALVGGQLVFTPAPNYEGPAGFDYTVTDGAAAVTGTVSGTVTPANDGPVAVPDTFTVAEDGSVPIPVLANDGDVDGDALTITRVDGQPIADGATVPVADGTVTLTGGELVFTPAPDFTGPATFTYTVTDGTVTDTARVEGIVTPVNDAPVAADDTFTAVEDTPVTIDVLSNDGDVDGDPLTITRVDGQPIFEGGAAVPVANGTVALTGGQLVFTPATGYVGPVAFGYTAQDPSGEPVGAAVTGTVASGNVAPNASADPVTTPEDTPVDGTITASDPNGDPLTFTVTDPPANGIVTVNPDGTYTYVPDPNANGPDSFTVTVTDPDGLSTTVTVSVTVEPINDAPDGVGTGGTTPANTPISGTLTMSDPDGDVPLASLGQPPAGGTATVNPDGTWTFMPEPGFEGPTSFTIIVDDGRGGTDEVTIEITVLPAVAQAPVLDIDDGGTTPTRDRAVATFEQAGPIPVAAPDAAILDADSPDMARLDIVLSGFDGPAETVAIGTRTLTYGTPANVAVSLGGTTFAVAYDGADAIAVTGQSGTMPVAALEALIRSVTYENTAEIVAPQQVGFGFTADDGGLASNTALALIDVAPVNDAPVAPSSAVATPEDRPVALDVPMPTDRDGTVAAITIDQAPPAGEGTITYEVAGFTRTLAAGDTLSPAQLATLVFTPAPNVNGPVTPLIYTAVDDAGASDAGSTAEVSLTVTPVNDVPVVIAPPVSTPEDVPISANVVVVDPDGPPPVVTLGTPPAHGLVVVEPDGTYTYVPDPNYNGPDTFTVVVDDGTDVVVTPVSITITPVDDPVAVAPPPPATGTDGRPFTASVADVFTDVDTPLAITVTGLPTGLTFDPATGLVTGTLPADASAGGPYTVTITATGGPEPVFVPWTIDVVNPAPVAVDTTLTVTPGEPVTVPIGPFRDPDGDPLTVTPVLPDWLTYDPATNIATGTVPPGADVTAIPVTLVDAQGATAEATITLVPGVANDVPTTAFVAVPETREAPRTIAPVEPILVGAVNETRSLGGTESLDGASGFILRAAESVDDLAPTVSAEPGDPFLVTAVEAIASLDGSLDVSAPLREQVTVSDPLTDGAGGEGIAVVAVPRPTAPAEPQREGDMVRQSARILEAPSIAPEELPATLPDASAMLPDASAISDAPATFTAADSSAYLDIATYKRGNTLFLDITDSFDPEVDGEVEGYSVTANGETPDWVREVRRGFYVLSPTAAGTVDLTVTAQMDDGREIGRTVRIDTTTGGIVPLGTDGQAATFLGQLKQTQGL